MRDRDSNETGQSHASQPSPEVTQPESLSRPLITEDYGLGDVIDQIQRLKLAGTATVSCRSKVNAGGRYVLEIEVVKRATPLVLDIQSAGGSTE